MSEITIAAKFPKIFQPLDTPARYKGIEGGRGSAKSRTAHTKALIKSISGYEKVLCAREYQSTIKDSVKALLDNQIRSMGLDDMFHSTRNEIICKENGSRFIFAGIANDPDKIKSMEGITLCLIEEANRVTQESINVLDPTIREDGSEIWAIYNRKYKDEPIHKMFVEEGRPDSIHIRANYYDNPFFPEVLRRQMEWDKAHDDGKYRHVWLGEPAKYSEALVFHGKWRIDESINLGEYDQLYYGADWGFAKDPTAIIRMWVDEDKREIYFDYEAYGVGVEMEDIPQLFDSVPDVRKWKITADSARPETISYIKRQGFKIESAKKGQGSVQDGVEFLKSYTLVVHPRCKHLIDELGLYSYKTDKITDEILPILEDKHNHVLDSARYGLEQLAFNRKKRFNM